MHGDHCTLAGKTKNMDRWDGQSMEQSVKPGSGWSSKVLVELVYWFHWNGFIGETHCEGLVCVCLCVFVWSWTEDEMKEGGEQQAGVVAREWASSGSSILGAKPAVCYDRRVHTTGRLSKYEAIALSCVHTIPTDMRGDAMLCLVCQGT